jgi:hypothetical protein
MKLRDIPVPDVAPLSDKEWNDLVYTGPYDHVGPVHGVTPLQVAIAKKTNCACYLLMTSLVGVLERLTSARIDQAFNEKAKEFIYLYQLDWRYPIPWQTSADFISKKRIVSEAVKQSIPFYFLTVLYRSKKAFCPNPVIQETCFMINFTLHLGGKQRSERIKQWVGELIERLEIVAPCPDQKSIYYPDFSDDADFLQAVLRNHGTPLSPRVLDPSVPLDEIEHRNEALAIVDGTDFAWNPVLRAPADFEPSFGIVGPYFSADRDW